MKLLQRIYLYDVNQIIEIAFQALTCSCRVALALKVRLCVIPEFRKGRGKNPSPIFFNTKTPDIHRI